MRHPKMLRVPESYLRFIADNVKLAVTHPPINMSSVEAANNIAAALTDVINSLCAEQHASSARRLKIDEER